jgi:hypothetical protein
VEPTGATRAATITAFMQTFETGPASAFFRLWRAHLPPGLISSDSSDSSIAGASFIEDEDEAEEIVWLCRSANVPFATRTYGEDSPSCLMELDIWAFTVAAGVAPKLLR